MFGNIPNNNSNNPNINSRAITWYCDLSCLQIGYWDDRTSIKLNPILNIGEDGKRNYDSNKRINTALTQEKAAAFADILKEEIVPLVKNMEEGKATINEVKSEAFPVGVGSAIAVEVRPNGDGKGDIFLVLYKNIKQDNTCDEKYEYQFNPFNRVRNYDPSTGRGEELKYHGEFITFVKILDRSIDAISSTAHGITYQNALSAKRSSYAANNGGGYQGYNNNGFSTPQNGSAPVGNMDEADDLPF